MTISIDRSSASMENAKICCAGAKRKKKDAEREWKGEDEEGNHQITPTHRNNTHSTLNIEPDYQEKDFNDNDDRGCSTAECEYLTGAEGSGFFSQCA